MITQKQADEAIRRAKIARHAEGPQSADKVFAVVKNALTAAGVPWTEIQHETHGSNAKPLMWLSASEIYHSLRIDWTEYR